MRHLVILVLAILIAYTQAQSGPTATLARCTYSGTLDYTTGDCQSPPNTFHWNVARISTQAAPCPSGYIELRRKLFYSSATTRLTIPDAYYPNQNAKPMANMIDVGLAGCIKPYSQAEHVFPNYNVIKERVYYVQEPVTGHYDSIAYGSFDNHNPLYPNNDYIETILGFAQPKKALTIVCQLATPTVISNYVFITTSAITCPQVIAIGGHVWAFDSSQTACPSGQVALKNYKNQPGTSSTVYRLGLTTPSDAAYFAYDVGCIPASPTVNTSALYEFRKGTGQYRYAWGDDDRERRINALFNQGYTELGAVANVNIFPNQAIKKFRSCWDSSASNRVYVNGGCYSLVDEGIRFSAWTDVMYDTNLVMVHVHLNSAESVYAYTLSTIPPSGYTYLNPIFAVKSVQAEGTHPLYQFKRTGLSTGSDVILTVNNTYVPLGYTQYGGILGYVYDAYIPPAGCNPMYQNCYKQIRSCLGVHTQRTYMINSATCSSGTNEGVSFVALPCTTNYDIIYGAGRQTFCRFTAGSPKSDVKILRCSSTPPSGYTLDPADLGCLATSSASGLVAIYPFTKTDGTGDVDTYYSKDTTANPGYVKGTRIGYALPGDSFAN